MLRLAVAFAAALPLFAEEWNEARSGPFEIWTNGNEKQARELLVRLEQMRHVLGTLMGKQEPVSVWTIRILALKKTTGTPRWTLGRDAWVTQIQQGQPLPRLWQREIARMLLESNARRIPAEWENGILDLLSTLDAQGPKITLGTPPEAAARTRDWARVHYLATREEYTTRWRVLLNNFQNGADEDVAFKNSIGKSRADLEKEIDAYVAAGQYGSAVVSGRAIAEKDFYMRPVEEPRVLAALADASGNPKLSPAGTLESFEALGLAAAEANQPAQARDLLKQAVANQSKSARVYLEYAKLLDTPDARRNAFVEAAKKNPRWAQPYVELAALETTGARVAFYLKTAASLDPRNSQLWQRLGRAQLEANQFSDASKSFFNAMLAAPTPQEKEAANRIRRQFEEEKAEKEDAERRRLAAEKQRELDRLKEEALNRIRMAEANANQGRAGGAPVKVEPWWDDKQPSRRLSGLLEKVDCIGKSARVWIKAPGTAKAVALLIKDPSQIVIIGGGEAAFTCGIQKPVRNASVEYKVRADPKLGTAGDVALLEFN